MSTPNTRAGRLGRWLIRWRVWLLLIGALDLVLVAALLVPGNPVLDLNVPRYRWLGTVLSHVGAFSLTLGCSAAAPRWLAALGKAPARTSVGVAVLVAVGAMALIAGVVSAFPAYGRGLLREWGLVEPLQAALYLTTAWVAWQIAVLRQARAAEHRPYRLVAAVCGLLMLDEIDYLGIFGGALGRIGGVYVGSLHDLVNLATHYPVVWAGLGAVGLAALATLRRRGYLTWGFIRSELPDPTTAPIYAAGAFLLASQLMDIDKTILSPTMGFFRYSLEEPLELLACIALNLGLVLKYRRDSLG